MRSESQLANIDLSGTQRVSGQSDAIYNLSHEGDITHAREERMSGRNNTELEAPFDEPGIEFAEEVGLAAKLHELVKKQDAQAPEVQSEWEVNLTVLPDVLTLDEMRQAHESVRSRIDALARIDARDLPDGAVLPTVSSRATAISAGEALFHGRGLVFQHVSPLADGGVELEFESSQLYVGLWIHGRENIDILIRRGTSESSLKARIDQLSDLIWERLV